MDIWSVVAERKIKEAMEEGTFDRLDGEYQPLPEDDSPFQDPGQRLAHRLMKNAGITPEWIAESREIDRQSAALSGLSGAEAAQRRAELNRRITLFNLKTPVRGSQKMFLPE